ncbi:MAG TPA: enoyl-CoA hydratase-related protein [Actinomycetota bacterium]|nr:enoyl-CoA hydratase-related protein [Actinomycetota bacterium]
MSVVELDRGVVATITINRPEAANCLSRATLDELAAAIETLATDDECRAVVLTGEGEKAFCAGADLKERATMTDDQVRDFVRTIRDTATELSRLPQPVIAAINGAAFGGGCELALACDIRVIDEGAQIGLTETSLGIIPGGGGTQRLPRLIGPARAIELIVTARRIDAAEACALGLANVVATSGTARKLAAEIADRIAANAPVAVRAAKEAAWRGLELPLREGLELETDLYQRTLGTEDRIEGLTAFREKRPPVYKGR